MLMTLSNWVVSGLHVYLLLRETLFFMILAQGFSSYKWKDCLEGWLMRIPMSTFWFCQRLWTVLVQEYLSRIGPSSIISILFDGRIYKVASWSLEKFHYHMEWAYHSFLCNILSPVQNMTLTDSNLGFKGLEGEPIHETWLRFQKLVLQCPTH